MTRHRALLVLLASVALLGAAMVAGQMAGPVRAPIRVPTPAAAAAAGAGTVGVATPIHAIDSDEWSVTDDLDFDRLAEHQQAAWVREQLQQQQADQMQQAQQRYLQQQRLSAYQQQKQQQEQQQEQRLQEQQQQQAQRIHADGPSITTVAQQADTDAESAEQISIDPSRIVPPYSVPLQRSAGPAAKQRDFEDRAKQQRRQPLPFGDPDEKDPLRRPRLSDDSERDRDPAWRRQCNERCDERTMELTGVGLHAIPSDKAEVRATIEFRRMVNTSKSEGNLEADQLQALISSVQMEVSVRAARVVSFLANGTAAAHISKLRTSSVSLEPLYEYREGRQFLMGYRASNSLAFRVDVAQAGMVIDAIVELGVSRIDGVSFIASPQYLNAARHVAISAAVEDAIRQAMSALTGFSKHSKSEPRDIQIIRMDIVGVTRPEAGNAAGSAAMPAHAPQAVMAQAKYFRSESAMDSGYSPVEGEEKVIGATVSMKIRF